MDDVEGGSRYAENRNGGASGTGAELVLVCHGKWKMQSENEDKKKTVALAQRRELLENVENIK